MTSDGDEKRITMPDRQTMLTRLCAVSDDDHYVERFYPLLTKAAGKELEPIGVVTMLSFAVYQYTKALGPNAAMAVHLLELCAEQFIDALVEDKAAAAETKNVYWQMRRKT